MSEFLFPLDLPEKASMNLGHFFRYHLARGFLEKGDIVVDAACGCGYGSKILSEVVKEVFSFDYTPKAIDIAKTTYFAPNISYFLYDLTKQQLPECDVVVTFETIEHLQDYSFFVEQCKTKARKYIISSVPIVPTVGINPFHKQDFTEDDFVNLFVDNNWKVFEKIHQRVYCVGVFYRDD